MTFYQFQELFPNDDACLDHMLKIRYGGHEFHCPKCGTLGKFYRIKRERAYVCQHCKHFVFPCVGTPMEKSRTPLHKWFFAIYLFSTSRHRVSAMELKRQLGVTYKCAWRMAHEIRKYMAKIDDEFPLDGDVEADETYIGGKKEGGKRGRGAEGKAIVFGMLERGGDVMTKVVPNVQKRTLQPIIKENILPGSTVHTDELRSYMGLGREGYLHQTVNHGAGEYSRNGCHVNSLEGFWARLKLSIQGTHVHVSPKHLWKYVKEFEFRYNRRKNPDSMFVELVVNLATPSLPAGR